MQRKIDMIIVNRIFYDILNERENLSFDDKVICFCENFKQFFFVYLNFERDEIINSCLKKVSF